uniref:Uncharacterized protein n=1 Tax=Labrus bergylta TaxID=56723 RepID=A0A3Q3GQ89_9LABR
MTSSVSASAGGVLVVTQVYPPNSQHQGQQVCEGMQTFSRAHPLAVGTVQIIIGAMVFLFGVAMVATQPFFLGAYSGFFVWGAAFYITAGSLTVAAGKSFNRCLVNTTLGFNVVASVASGTAIILYTLDATIWFCYDCPYLVFSLLSFFSDLRISRHQTAPRLINSMSGQTPTPLFGGGGGGAGPCLGGGSWSLTIHWEMLLGRRCRSTCLP